MANFIFNQLIWASTTAKTNTEFKILVCQGFVALESTDLLKVSLSSILFTHVMVFEEGMIDC